MEPSAMTTRLLPWLQRLIGWRLAVLVAFFSLLAVESLVASMDLLLKGAVPPVDLLIGLVTTTLVAPPIILLVSHLLRELARNKRRTLERNLSSVTTHLSVALDTADEGILMVAQDGTVLAANPRFLELWRVPPELAAAGQDKQLLAHALDQLADPDAFLERVRELYCSDQESRDTLHFKDRRVFARYSRTWANGSERGRIWCFKDVTEQTRTQAALAEREELYRAIVSQAGDGIDVIDATTLRFIEVNDAACEMLGYTRDELLRLSLPVIQAEFDEAALRENVKQLEAAGQTQFESRHRRKDGSIFNVHINVRMLHLHDRSYLVSVWRDISAAIRLREAQHKAEQELRTILDNVDAYIYLKDAEGHYLFANRAVRELWQAEMEDIVGFGDEKFFAAATAAAIRSNDRRVLGAGETLRTDETNTVTATGKTATYQSIKLPLRHADGRIYALCGISIDITARKQVEEALRESEEAFRRLFDEAANPVLLYDLENGRVIDCNRALVGFLNYEKKEDLIGLPSEAIVLPVKPDGTPSGPLFQAKIAEAMTAGCAHFDCQPVTRDGQPRDVAVSLTALTYRGKRILHAQWVDIAERKRAAEKLQLAASVFTHTKEGITITAPDGSIIDVNEAFTQITGYSREEVLGKNPHILSSGRHNKAFYADLWCSLNEKGHWYGEVWNRRKNGEIFAEMLTISAVRDAQDAIQHYVALFSDITQIKEHEKQLEHIAHYDALTTLPNRVLLTDRLHQGMAQAQRRGQRLAVAYLDLDGFKAVNDQHGHEAGDQLLIDITAHMKEALREGDTLARIGGDEFVAILLDLDSIADSAPLLTRLLAAACQPVVYGEHKLQISASLGVTFYPQAESMEPDQLLRQADQAMYQAKLAGKNRYHVFDAENDRSVRGHHESLEQIRQALTQEEFVLHFQPKVNMRTGAVIGTEALIRWQHPERGLLPPGVFLPVIEDHPLAIMLGEWVIDAALRQMARWQTAGLRLPVSVNIGASQLQQPDFSERLGIILARHPEIPPSDLELEVLETSALEDLVHATATIDACHTLGVDFALDDFGTGYSSLTYLKRLPVAMLKIDQSFVRDMLDDPDDLAILEGIIGLAAAFGREVIAEGVESVEHGDLLLQLGCHLGQGYGIARPMPADQIPGWIARWRPSDSWSRQPLADRQDLPLVLASVEHRAWIVRLENHLKGRQAAPPDMDPRQCQFGRYLASADPERWSGHTRLQDIDALHQQIHSLAAKALTLHAHGRTPEALTQINKLESLNNALRDQLQRRTPGNQ
ncbi:MAG: EAL domain-containing protein [Rugosibacter sp.]|nr:EAL domain-containing protein [Rugosibacter sp.]